MGIKKLKFRRDRIVCMRQTDAVFNGYEGRFRPSQRDRTRSRITLQ